MSWCRSGRSPRGSGRGDRKVPASATGTSKPPSVGRSRSGTDAAGTGSPANPRRRTARRSRPTWGKRCRRSRGGASRPKNGTRWCAGCSSRRASWSGSRTSSRRWAVCARAACTSGPSPTCRPRAPDGCCSGAAFPPRRCSAAAPPPSRRSRQERRSWQPPSAWARRSRGPSSSGRCTWSDARAAQRAGLRAVLLDRAGAWPHLAGGRIASLAELDAALERSATPIGGPSTDDAAPGAEDRRSSGDFL